jgi:NAD(P)H-flavin reductase
MSGTDDMRPATLGVKLTYDEALAFQPGQAIIVGEHGQPERRPYSIARVGEMKVGT